MARKSSEEHPKLQFSATATGQGRLVKETSFFSLVCARCGEVNPYINLLVANVAQQQCGNPMPIEEEKNY